MARGGDKTVLTTQAGLLAWILPGAGHWLLGQRGLAAVFFTAITFCYLAGLALGGLKTSVNPKINHWLFLAELGVGGYTFTCFGLSQTLPDRTEYLSYYPSSDLSQIYLSVAGLLNVLAVLDAMARAQTGGLPVFYHELRRRAGEAEGGG